jgi:hypothetical protein
LLLSCFHNLCSSCSDDEEPPTYVTATSPPSPTAIDEPVEPDVAPRATRSSVKKVSQSRYPKRSKKAKEATVSLEAHASTVSSDDVSTSSLLAFLVIHFCSYTLLFSGFSQEVYCPRHGVCRVPKGCESF